MNNAVSLLPDTKEYAKNCPYERHLELVSGEAFGLFGIDGELLFVVLILNFAPVAKEVSTKCVYPPGVSLVDSGNFNDTGNGSFAG